MKLPRNLDAKELVKALKALGYRQVRQTGSHIRLETDQPSIHAVTIPNHSPLRVGTLAAILADIAAHHQLSREQLLDRLFGG